jgi:hypothetical protein
LKLCDRPYLSFDESVRQVKLKKDYIVGLGDSADLAIVGGRRDAKDEYELRMGKLWWTTFYLGCLENKEEVGRNDVKPRFRIVAMVDRHSISKPDLQHLNQLGQFRQVPFARCRAEMDVELDQPHLRPPTALFRKPMVVEVVGAGFDKPADVRYFTLRFPRIKKVHEDRTSRDIVSFDELQELARQSITISDGGDHQSEGCDAKNVDDADSELQRTDSTYSHRSVSSRHSTQITESSDLGIAQEQHRSCFARSDADEALSGQQRITGEESYSTSRTLDSPDVQSLKRKLLSDHDESLSMRRRSKKCSATATGMKTPQEREALSLPSPEIPESDLGAGLDQLAGENGSLEQSVGSNEQENVRGQSLLSDDVIEPALCLTKFQMPFFLSTSPADSGEASIDICRALPFSFTFSVEVFVRHIQMISSGSVVSGSSRTLVYVILIDGARPNLALTDAASVAAALTKLETSGQIVVDFNICFLDRGLLALLGSSDVLQVQQWQQAVKGYMQYRGGRLVEFLYGNLAWEKFLRNVPRP